MLELVIVVMILAIVAAIAIPRMSRGSQAAAEVALENDLATLRRAIELYTVEHDGRPPPVANIRRALLEYSNRAGTSFSPTKDTKHYFGPYMRTLPTLPLGIKEGNEAISEADGEIIGWIYDPATGEISANTTSSEKDAGGVLYSNY